MNNSFSTPYRGRFAPTPSGPLHAGSLLTALASWLCARARGGHWLLRIDDLDRARCRPEHADTILHQLEAHGLLWEETPRYQSRHIGSYRDALARLDAAGLVYRCRCTRAVLADEQLPSVDGPVYAGRCRDLGITDGRTSQRLRVGNGTITLDDHGQDRLTRDIAWDIGDFVLRRVDGIIGYHLACAIDEAEQGITEVVRGADLLAATFCQRLVLNALDHESPAYRHLPILPDASGRKLSKQNHAQPVDNKTAASNLLRGLRQLGQTTDETLSDATVVELLDWAQQHWDPSRIPHTLPAAKPASVVD